MKIKISKKTAEEARESLSRGHYVILENLGSLYMKKRPARVAFHNFSGKKITIAGFERVILIPKK